MASFRLVGWLVGWLLVCWFVCLWTVAIFFFQILKFNNEFPSLMIPSVLNDTSSALRTSGLMNAKTSINAKNYIKGKNKQINECLLLLGTT